MATGSVSPKTGKIVNIPDETVTIGTATDSGTGSTVSVPFTAGSVATGGPVNYFTATSTPGSLTANGGSSPITVSGLSSGTAYTFKVKAGNATGYSSAGESAASNSVTPEAPGVFESIATVTAAGGESSFTFSSIPQTYKHLQLRSIVRMQGGGNDYVNWYLRPNNNTGTIYSYHHVRGTGASVVGAGGGFADNYLVVQFSGAGSTTTSGIFGASVVDFIDYNSTTKLKTVNMTNGVDFNSSTPTGHIALTSSLMNSTSAITSIVALDLNGYNFAAGSTIALYGIKGA